MTDARPPLLRRVHASARRVRLRFDGAVPEGTALAAFADRLASVEGVLRARVRPSTGSVILDLAQPPDAVLGTLAEAGIARIGDPPKPVPVGQAIQFGLLRADASLGARTSGALDLRTALGLFMLVAAMVQLSRGRIAGPATTLFMSAWSLLAAANR
ncbi:MAG: hypothetical protein ACLFRZ_04400 [Rhodosalinus sp.]|uniref:hypothetical protein n=1 Tax=Rhodosalinus sp. TaxID=2047741 RepID=UPI00397B64FD